MSIRDVERYTKCVSIRQVREKKYRYQFSKYQRYFSPKNLNNAKIRASEQKTKKNRKKYYPILS